MVESFWSRILKQHFMATKSIEVQQLLILKRLDFYPIISCTLYVLVIYSHNWVSSKFKIKYVRKSWNYLFKSQQNCSMFLDLDNPLKPFGLCDVTTIVWPRAVGAGSSLPRVQSGRKPGEVGPKLESGKRFDRKNESDRIGSGENRRSFARNSGTRRTETRSRFQVSFFMTISV